MVPPFSKVRMERVVALLLVNVIALTLSQSQPTLSPYRPEAAKSSLIDQRHLALDTLIFGTVALGDTKTMSATITNPGNDTLHIACRDSTSGPFKVLSFPTIIPPRDSALAFFRCDAQFIGSRIGTIIFTNNTPAAIDSVVLSGYSAFISSNLPVVSLNTHGQNVQEEARVVATMGIINNPNGRRNFVTDTCTDYNGRISIEYHGSSTAQFPKRSYRIETQDSGGNNNNVSLLSLPAENDWILYAPYTDKSLLRNELPYHLARSLGQYASRTAFCELLVNGEYMGIYALMEKIKRSKNRVNIAKLKTADTTGDALTGGYIIKMDKPYLTGWQVNVTPSAGYGKAYYLYDDPNEGDLVAQQKAYIQDFVFKLEAALMSLSFADTATGYAKYMNVDSFVDHLLLQELSKCLDSYRFSFYMYKPKQSDGGKLCAGPIWDFDIAFGNYDDHAWERPWTTDSWIAEVPSWCRSFWMKRLLEDNAFRNKLATRWTNIRKGTFSEPSLLAFIDSTVSKIAEARVRNFIRWPIIGVLVWPNHYVGSTYESEVANLKSWIRARLNWMDIALTGDLLAVRETGSDGPQAYALAQNYPNPFNPTTKVGYTVGEMGSRQQAIGNSQVKLAVYDLLGREVAVLVDEKKEAGNYEVTWDARGCASGVYVCRMTAGSFVATRKLTLLR
jgi:hypothetical protein